MRKRDMRRFKDSLITKTALVASALALLVAFSAMTMSYQLARLELSESIDREMDRRSDILAIQLRNEFNRLAIHLKENAANRIIANGLVDNAGRDNYLRPYLQSTRHVGDMNVSIMLTDYMGRPMIDNSVNPQWQHRSSLAMRAVQANEPQATILDVEEGPLVIMAWPVLYANTDMPEGALVYVCTMHEIAQNFPQSPAPTQFMVTWKAPGRRDNFLFLGDPPRRESFSLSKPVELPEAFGGLTCSVTVWSDRAVYNTELSALSGRYVTVGTIGFLGIVLTSVASARWLLGRLRLLESTARQVTATRSLDLSFPETGRDEITSIARVFNMMLGDLRAAQQALRDETSREVRKHAGRTERILATTAEGYIRIDVRSGSVLEINEAFCAMMSTTCREWEGLPCPDHLQDLLQRARSASHSVTWPTQRLSFDLGGTGTKTFLVHASLDVDEDDARQLAIFFTDIQSQVEAEEAALLANEKLTATISHLERRDREWNGLNIMNDMLLMARNDEEVHAIVAESARKIFLETSGALCILTDKARTLKAVVRWGDASVCEELFPASDCWAIRQGKAAATEPGRVVQCGHFSEQPAGHSICIPLVTESNLLGLLWSETSTSPYTSSDSFKAFLHSFAESIKLSLFNHQLRSALHRQATRDPLTGLYNRRHFSETFDYELAKAQRSSAPLSLAIIDIDHFKSINDRYGHDAGDAVLVGLAKSLQKLSRTSDMVFRYGGGRVPRVSFRHGQRRSVHLRRKHEILRREQ